MIQLFIFLRFIKEACAWPYKNNKFKKSTPTQDEEFELPDIQNNLDDYIIKKHETFTDKSSIQIYINRIQNRIARKIKNGCYLEHLTLETMKLLKRRLIKEKED